MTLKFHFHTYCFITATFYEDMKVTSNFAEILMIFQYLYSYLNFFGCGENLQAMFSDIKGLSYSRMITIQLSMSIQSFCWNLVAFSLS
jgi:hypothetical protein